MQVFSCEPFHMNSEMCGYQNFALNQAASAIVSISCTFHIVYRRVSIIYNVSFVSISWGAWLNIQIVNCKETNLNAFLKDRLSASNQPKCFSSFLILKCLIYNMPTDVYSVYIVYGYLSLSIYLVTRQFKVIHYLTVALVSISWGWVPLVECWHVNSKWFAILLSLF